jgi:hypothetical protein
MTTRRIFEHATDFSFEEIGVENTENGRYYITPEEKRYPSVTTILSKGTDQSWKDKWIARVGEEKAKRISKKATKRGESLHGIIERYLRNEVDFYSGCNYFDRGNFESLRPILDKKIGQILGLEVPLYSNLLRTAGRVDCIAEWDGILSIVDFKTSTKNKNMEQILNYLLQESAYAYMVYERFNRPISQIVTLISVDNESPQVFVEKTKNYLPEFIKIRNSLTI